MTNRLILLTILLSFNLSRGYSQDKPTLELSTLDNSFFKWKEFSFNQPWEKVKNICEIEKIDSFDTDYQNYYCGNISDTKKSYVIKNTIYQEFNSFVFDKVLLRIEGTSTSNLNHSSLYFFKQLEDSTNAFQFYKEILKSFKTRYGNNRTEYLEKFNKDIVDKLSKNVDYTYLGESYPYSSLEQTEWYGNKNIFLKLRFNKEINLVVFSVEEDLAVFYNKNSRNWFKESEYDEQFTKEFKEFDNKNGFKGLKFGMLKPVVRNIVSFKEADALGEYKVSTPAYKNWFYIPFDDCKITFNKKNQFYDLTLSKDEYSNDDYEKFLKELIDMFGNPTTYKEKKETYEYTRWKGKKFSFVVMRPDEASLLYVDFVCTELDDYSPTDKLY